MLTGRQILVVEDEALIAMEIEDQLADAGAEIAVAATVNDALRLIENWCPDAAVLDCLLGNEWVTPVGDRLAELGVPVVFVTAYDEDHCNRGRHPTAPLLSKPFEPDKLVSVVAGLFRDGQQPEGRHLLEAGRESADSTCRLPS